MRRALLVVGALAVVGGVGLAIALVGSLLVSGWQTEQAQQRLGRQWAEDSGRSSAGTSATEEPGGRGDADGPGGRAMPAVAVAVLYAPRLGASWSWLVVDGVREQDLARGPGRYPHSEMPGERGNFAVAGHRATHGEPFADLDRLRPGDRIVAETRTAWHVYRVRRSRVTGPDRWDLVADVPGRPAARPRRAYLTLTTCHPRWGSSERLVVTGELDRSVPHDAGPPDAVSPAAVPAG